MRVMHPVDPMTLRILVDLSEDPRDVASTSDYPSFAVVIPEYLYERYLMYQSIESSPPTEPKKSGAKK